MLSTLNSGSASTGTGKAPKTTSTKSNSPMATSLGPVSSTTALGGKPEISKTVLNQIYARLRATMLQLWLPSLCTTCKSIFLKASRQADKPFPLKDFCQPCRQFLVSKQQKPTPGDKVTKPTISIGSPNKAKFSLAAEKTGTAVFGKTETATSIIKNRVISEIEALIKPSLAVDILKTSSRPAKATEAFIGSSELHPPRNASLSEQKIHIDLPLPLDNPIYETFTQLGIGWCRYCGTTAGTSWRPGPWGPRSLCFRHGREYSVHKRLDLSSFESVEDDRKHPVLQDFCKVCWKDEGIVRKCHGCANGFHAHCYLRRTGKNVACLLAKPWYCNSTCLKHFETGSIRVVHSSKDPLPFQEHDATSTDENISDAETFKAESLDVVSHDPQFKPTFIIRLKEPIRPPTPVPELNSKLKAVKRRQSCPIPSLPQQKPAKKLRKSRTLSQSVPDFLISIDHSAVVRREDSMFKPVLVPSYRPIPRPAEADLFCHDTLEDTSEEAFSSRHYRFEEVEKHTRLLKPDVLSSLFGIRRD